MKDMFYEYWLILKIYFIVFFGLVMFRLGAWVGTINNTYPKIILITGLLMNMVWFLTITIVKELCVLNE